MCQTSSGIDRIRVMLLLKSIWEATISPIKFTSTPPWHSFHSFHTWRSSALSPPFVSGRLATKARGVHRCHPCSQGRRFRAASTPCCQSGLRHGACACACVRIYICINVLRHRATEWWRTDQWMKCYARVGWYYLPYPVTQPEQCIYIYTYTYIYIVF